LKNHTLIPISYYTKSQLDKHNLKSTLPVYPLLKEPIKLNQPPIFPKKENKTYILHISDFNVRKNIPFIQELFTKLNKDKYVLIRIGEKIPNIENQIAFKNISDIQKLNIIQNSDLCISPSIDEGFNMPIAECILNNIPVISSNIPVINEIYENKIISIDTNNINNWINTIENNLWKYDTYTAKNILLKKINQSKNNLINILNND
ncbi:MAG: glycosyltransferase, partial [Caldisphaera sp.]|uniref:glycosyltransferase n=1 Tax=Caldisphaera sp. TaxID=2060322 RepID=UPI003D0AFA30